MDIDAASIAQVLSEHPAPALPLDRVCRLLGRRRGGAAPGEDEVGRALRASPDRFLVLDPWQGPWEPLLAGGRRRETEEPCAFEPWGLAPATPWVVARPDAEPSESDPVDEGPDSGPGPSWPGLNRLRESVRWYALTVDAGSPVAVARWTRMLRQEGEVRQMVTGVAEAR